MSETLRVLLLEDQPADAELILRELHRSGYAPEWKRVETEQGFLAQLDQGWECILADYNLPQFDGLRALALLNECGRDIPFILVSGTIGEDKAVEAMRTGASDYILKDRMARLGPAVKRALHDASERGRRRTTEAALRESEERFRALVESATDAIITIGTDLRIHVYNAAAARIFGFTKQEMLGRKVDMLIPPEYAERHRHGMLRYQEAGQPTVLGRIVELRGQRKDGSIFPVELAVSESSVDGARAFTAVIRDISERKRNEEALRVSEAKYRALFESSRDAILTLFPPDWRVASANCATIELFGATDEQAFRALALWDASPERQPDGELSAAKAERMMRTAMEEGSHFFEWTHRRIGGETFPSTVLLTRVQWNGTVGLQATVRDITQAKRVEVALRESEARFRATFEQAAVGIAHVALDGSWLWMNKKYCDVVGYGEAELLRRRFQESTHPDDLPANIDGARRLLAGEIHTYSAEKRYVREDQSIVWVRVTVSLVRDDEGNPQYFIAVMEDIAARKRAEDILHLQSAALNAAANAIVITDANGAIEWINAAFSSLTGYSWEEAVGKNPRELIKSGSHDQAFYTSLWETILAGKVWHGELTNRRKDGSLYVEEQTITPVLNDRGDVTHFIAIKRDLTAQRQLQAQFLQAQKMETVGRLAGGIAHDFNNLLTVINGTAEIAAADLREDDPLRKELTEIRRAGDRAAALTRQLLAFSRKQIMKYEILDLGRLMTDLKGMLQRLIGENVILGVTGTRDLGNVLADPGQIEQVVMNLAVNARDAMPNGGELTIGTRNVEVDEAFAAEHPSLKPGPYVLLSISDTGVGMDDATRARVFEPFFTTKSAGKGTGLGLATVYGIVKQSGGGIWVDSALGRGTSVEIYLSRVEGAARKVEPASNMTSVRGTETILVVEDDNFVRHLAVHLLQSAGYAVLTASSGADAIAVLERHGSPVPLVLTDMVMPGMSGPDLARQLEQVSPQTKIIFTSGYTDDSIVNQQLPSAASHFIAKPYTAAQLTRKVREVLDSPGGR